MYAAVQVAGSHVFILPLTSHFLDPCPVLVCGDFNCLCDSVSDGRGLIITFTLRDAWVALHGP